jgi:hypothetical protein
MTDFFTSRIAHLREVDRPMPRWMAHGGHMVLGFIFAALPVLIAVARGWTLFPYWMLAVAGGVFWVFLAEFVWDRFLNGYYQVEGDTFWRRHWDALFTKRAEDSWWDTYQILGGAGVVVLILLAVPSLWWLLLVWAVVYFLFVKRM